MKQVTVFAFALLMSVVTFAQTWSVDKAHSGVSFTLTHLGISEVDGKFPAFDAKITSAKPDFSDAVFELSADITKVNTNNEMRDGHLQKEDMFNTEKFPTLTFKSTSIKKIATKKVKGAVAPAPQKYTLVGDLTMKGVTKPYTLELTLLGTTVDQRSKKNKAGFKATGVIKRTDFGVGGMPSMMVSDEIQLRASGEFVQD